jgi:hypothetical protein
MQEKRGPRTDLQIPDEEARRWLNEFADSVSSLFKPGYKEHEVPSAYIDAMSASDVKKQLQELNKVNAALDPIVRRNRLMDADRNVFNQRVQEYVAVSDPRVVGRAFTELFGLCAGGYDACQPYSAGGALIECFLAKPPKVSPDDLRKIADALENSDWAPSIEPPAVAGMLVQLSKLGVDVSALKSLAEACLRHWSSPHSTRYHSEGVLQAARVKALRITEPGRRYDVAFNTPITEPFKGAEGALRSLLEHCATAGAPKPNDKWRKAAEALLATAGPTDLRARFERSLDELRRLDTPVGYVGPDFLRGVAWFLGISQDLTVCPLLGKALVVASLKLPGTGPRCEKLFNGALWALSQLPGDEPLAEMSRARAKVKSPKMNSALASALETAAKERNLDLDVLEEMIVPTYGMEAPGFRTETLGEVEARLEITGSTNMTLRWFKDGKELKSAPAAAKEFAEELAELKKAKKESEATLSAQKHRLESLFLQNRGWSYRDWLERYLEHPLLANMVRRLIWQFDGPSGTRLAIPLEGIPTDSEKRQLSDLEECTVTLWHPLDAGLSAIEVWRDFLVREEIQQPFKQAFREIYLLTDAERKTGVYSNRFAAHVLKQHQFAALAHDRGWRYSLLGAWDNASAPFATLRLRRWEMSALYAVDVAEIQEPAMTDAGIVLYVATDQVRFVDQRGQALELEQIPQIVFSEVMRDVDLFTGVASVGNDPTWADAGPTGFRDYWHSFAFGDLSVSAATRGEVLGKLIPRLAKLSAAKVDGKFLIVPGRLRTYKIHLGSGNILMSPNDQYLCIVPGFATEGKAASKLYVPFEGDRILDVILSKALLLADDDKIKDSTIVKQIKTT